MQGQSVIGPHTLSSLMEVQSTPGATLFVAGDSVYYFIVGEVSEEDVLKRTDVLKEMFEGTDVAGQIETISQDLSAAIGGKQRELVEALAKTETGGEAGTETTKVKTVHEHVKECCKDAEDWISSFLLVAPVTGGATDTSTSDPKS